MIFFGVWALFSLSFFSGKIQPLYSIDKSTDIGRVLSPRNVPLVSTLDVPLLVSSQPGSTSDESLDIFQAVNPESSYHANSEAFNERVLGRIFAWLCTTLYLTSRLPQIWKNVGYSNLGEKFVTDFPPSMSDSLFRYTLSIL